VNDFFIPFGNIFSLFRSKVKGLYNFGLGIVNGSTLFNQYAKDREKLEMVLSNPAVLKVFALQCNLFSMGKVKVTKESGEEIEDDPFLSLLRKPNPFTKTESQFLWDFMFWNMLGTSYTYVDSKDVGRKLNKMYFLDPSKIEWPMELETKKDKMIFSESAVNDIMKTEITYRYQDGTTFKFPFDRLVISHDLTNSIGNFFKGPSRLDALYKIISNAEYTLDAENINIRYSGKFLAGADKQIGQTTKLGFGDAEKTDLETKIDSNEKNVWAVNSMVKIQRFVSDMAALKLPEQYLHLYFLIGNMYDIPRDVLEAYNSATFENQEKARAAHVNYCLEPKGEQFMDAFEEHFEYRGQGKKIDIDWGHLPFVQIFAKERIETKKATVETLNSLLTVGVSIDDANKYLETDFVIEPPQDIAEENKSPETLAAQAALRGSVGGVQGILAVQASVAAGTTDYNAAISILTVIYGFTGQQAIDLLGQPSGQSEAEAGTGSEAEADQPTGDSEKKLNGKRVPHAVRAI
jgi:hypothetical protein